MAVTPEVEADAAGTGRRLDDIQRRRNKLVTLVQEGNDDDRAWATSQLQKLNDDYGGYDPAAGAGKPLRTAPNQDDPNPLPPLEGGIGSRGQTYAEEPGKSGFGAAIRRVDRAALGLITDPKKLGNQAYRDQMLAQYDRGFSGGLLRRGANQLGIDDRMTDEGLERAGRETPLSEGEKGLAYLAGVLSPSGLARLGGKAVAGLAVRVPGVAKLAAKAPIATAAGVGAAEAAGAAGLQAGTEAATTTGNVSDAPAAAAAAATDPVNAGLGALFGGAFGAGAKIRARNPNVELIESRGGRVGTFTPGSGGAMDDPLVQRGMENGRVTERGKGIVSRESADAVADRLEGRGRAVGEELRAGQREAEAAGNLDQPVDITDLYVQVQQMVSNKMLPREVRGKIQQEILDDVLTPMASDIGVGPGKPFMVAAREANDIKKKLQYFAEFVPSGKPGAAEPNFAQLSHEAGQSVGDDLSRLNRKANEQYKNLESAREGFGIPGGANDQIPLSQREGLATRLGRRGADNRYAGRDVNPQIEEALNRYPELRRYVEAPELLQARGNLEFGLGGNKVGGLYEKMKNIVGRNIDPAAVRLLAPLLMSVGRQAPVAPTIFDEMGKGLRSRMDSR
jgi:hypothetical protein